MSKIPKRMPYSKLSPPCRAVLEYPVRPSAIPVPVVPRQLLVPDDISSASEEISATCATEIWMSPLRN
jgi:hypothetical protein